LYLGQQGIVNIIIVNINWDKIQSISQGVLSMVTNTITTASSSLLPATTMMTNPGISLTGSTALGFDWNHKWIR
jgi:hypothetical protein